MTQLDTMTDKELIDLYFDETEPITRWHIAEHIKDETTRKDLIWEAKVARQRAEEPCGWED